MMEAEPKKIEGGAVFTARPLILSVVGAEGNLSTAHAYYLVGHSLLCN